MFYDRRQDLWMWARHSVSEVNNIGRTKGPRMWVGVADLTGMRIVSRALGFAF